MLLTNPQNSCAFELHIMSRGGLPVLVYNTEENRTTPIRARPASSSLFHHIFPIQFVFLLLSNKECAIYIRGNVQCKCTSLTGPFFWFFDFLNPAFLLLLLAVSYDYFERIILVFRHLCNCVLIQVQYTVIAVIPINDISITHLKTRNYCFYLLPAVICTEGSNF